MDQEDVADGLYDAWRLKELDEKRWLDEDEGYLEWTLKKKWGLLPPPVHTCAERPTFRVDLWSDQIIEMYRASDLLGKYMAQRVDEEMMKNETASDKPVRGRGPSGR